MRGRLRALLLLHVLCVLHGLPQEHILHYDKASGLLHFSCPLESVMTDKKLIVANFGHYNQWTGDGQMSKFAKWFNNTATGYDRRTVLNNTRRVGLTGFLADVRCRDSQTYCCSYHYADPREHIEWRVENVTFTFEGPSSVSITKPPQTHHCPGDTIELKCRARLGRQNNVIVWESKTAGERQFSADISSKTNHSVPMDTKTCNYVSESTLSRVLTGADNERVWRCRLTYGDATDDIIIAVDQTKVSSTTHGLHDKELAAAGPELFIPSPLGDVDADNEYAGFSDDHLDLDPMSPSPHNSHDAVSGPGSAVPPPPFDPEYSQLGGDSEDYHRLGRHGNSQKVVDSASPAELSYQHLSYFGQVPETRVSDWMITATESSNNPDKVE